MSALPLRPLAELCERVTVGHVGKTSEYYRAEGVPFLRTQNVGKGKLVLDDLKFITQEFHDSLQKSQLKSGDVLVTRVVTDEMKCGIVPVSLGRANCANVILIRPKPELSPKFLSYLITSPVAQSYLLGRRVGSAQQVVNTKVLKDWPVPKLPIAEQKRIVAVLDHAFAALDRAHAHAEANLADADELLRSVQITAAENHNDWVTAKISTLIRVKSGDFLPSKAMDVTGAIPVFGGNGQTGLHNKSNLKGRNILIGRVGAKCGNVRVVDTPIWLTDNAFHVSELYRDFDLDFLALLLSSADLRITANQAAQPAISATTIGSVEIRFPESVEEQKRHVQRVRSIQVKTLDLAKAYQQKLAAITNLRQSLLQKAFSGQLT